MGKIGGERADGTDRAGRKNEMGQMG